MVNNLDSLIQLPKLFLTKISIFNPFLFFLEINDDFQVTDQSQAFTSGRTKKNITDPHPILFNMVAKRIQKNACIWGDIVIA